MDRRKRGSNKGILVFIKKAFPRDGNSIKYDDISEQIYQLIQDSVRIRLISEVPLGAFLSGGIDSSTIVALMSQVAKSRVKTFSIIFNEQEFNEARYSRLISQKFITDHHEILVSEKHLLDEMPNAIAAMDQPTIDGINTYFVSQATKQAGITVALSGLGGDELFGGYDSFRTVPQMQNFINMWKWMPSVSRSLIGKIFNLFVPNNERNLKILSLIRLKDNNEPYFLTRQLFSMNDKRAILKLENLEEAELKMQGRIEYFLKEAKSLDSINRVSFYELGSYMPNMLLRDTDFMSMAHSLEVRVPFLDYRLVEFMLSLPGYIKIDKNIPKSLLVKAMDKLLPDQVIYRPKQGFTFPFDYWMKNQLRKDIEATINDELLNDCFNEESIYRLWNEFLSGHRSWSRLWSIYILKKWVSKFL